MDVLLRLLRYLFAAFVVIVTPIIFVWMMKPLEVAGYLSSSDAYGYSILIFILYPAVAAPFIIWRLYIWIERAEEPDD